MLIHLMQKNTIQFLMMLFMVLNAYIVLASQNSLPIISGVGGDFTAVNGDGKEIKFSSLKGKVVVLAFGYTNCADICPFTLGYLKQLYKILTPEEQKVTQIVFVTVDPKYDTPEHLKAFVEFFNKDFMGLSGTQEQIDYIASLYQAELHSLSDDGSAEMNHIGEYTIKPGESLVLKPMSYHLMFTNINHDVVKKGGKATITLTFKKTGDISFTVPVASD